MGKGMEVKSIIKSCENGQERDKCIYTLPEGKALGSQRRLRGFMLAEQRIVCRMG